MALQTIDVRPVAGALGAEVFGADLSQDLYNRAHDEIHRAFLDHQVLFIRDQTLTPAQHAAFARRFGPLNIYPFVEAIEGAPEIIEIVKEAGERNRFGAHWHADQIFTPTPAMATMMVLAISGNDTTAAASAAAIHVKTISTPKALWSRDPTGPPLPRSR